MLGEDVRLELSLAPDLGHVRANPAQLEQVLMNLTVNARDAMPDGGSLTIEMANVDFAEAVLLTEANLPPGAYVMLELSDTGVGMTPDVQARIFEPFFTTKGPTKGTGLGLAMVYGVVTQSGGQISVYSEPGAGSTFKIYLPRVMAETGERLPVPAEARAAGGTETVLLAEDNEAVRVLAERVLRSEGYAVLVAAHGYEALQLAQAHAGTIHLLLTDVMMRDERSSPGRGARAGSSRDGRALHVGVHGANRCRARVPPGGDTLSPEAVHPGGVDPKSARDAGRVPPDVTAPVERPWVMPRPGRSTRERSWLRRAVRAARLAETKPA
jgi:CheY-like chemotaxis protein